MKAMAHMYTQDKMQPTELNLPKYLVQVKGTQIEPLLEKSLADGYGVLDFSKVLGTPGIGDLVRKYSGRIRIAAEFDLERADEEHSTHEPSFKSIREQCQNVLTALSIEKIDFFYQKPRSMGLDATKSIPELQGLVLEGSVGHIGISETDPATIRQAHAILPLLAVTVAVSPWSPPNKNPVVEVCRELGIKIIANEVNARGLINLDANTRENAASVVSTQREALLAKLKNAQGLTGKALAKKTMALSGKYPEVLSSTLQKIFVSQDSLFLEKLESVSPEIDPQVVAHMRTMMESQRSVLSTAVASLVSKRQEHLQSKLESMEDASDSKILGVITRTMDSLTARLSDKLNSMRSKQFETRLKNITSKLGEDSTTCKMTARIFERQSLHLSKQIQMLRARQTDRLMAVLDNLKTKKREQAENYAKDSIAKHMGVMEKKLPRTLSRRGKANLPVGVAKILKNHSTTLEERIAKETAAESRGTGVDYEKLTGRQESALVKKIDKVIENQMRKNEKKALAVFGEQLNLDSRDNSEDWDRDQVGRMILEQGLILNKELHGIAEKKDCAPLVVATAWVHNQGDDITILSPAQEVKHIGNLNTAAELAKGEEVASLEEHIGTYQENIMTGITWVNVNAEECIAAQ